MATIRITADDYGVHDTIDVGIRQCVRNGTLDNIDAMVTHNEYSKVSIQKLLEEFKPKFKSGELSLGLHLSLSCGSPLYRANEEYLNAIAKLEKIKKTGQERYFFRYHGRAGLAMIERIEELIQNYLPQLIEEMNAQYLEFKRITHEVIPNYEPSQISSHLGVFIANKEIYEASRDFCKTNNLRMRCPTLMKYDPQYGQLWQTDPEPQFLPAELIELLAQKEGRRIIDWVKKDQYPAFIEDRAKGLNSTDYFVEHFFRNGTLDNLKRIVNRMRSMGNQDFELVVHPVGSKETKDLPNGISTLNYAKRYEEFKTLKDLNTAKYIATLKNS